MTIQASRMLLALDYFEFVDATRNKYKMADPVFLPVGGILNQRRFSHERAREILLRFGIECTNRADKLPLSRFLQKLLRDSLDREIDFIVDADSVNAIVDEMVECNWVDEFVPADSGFLDRRGDLTNPASYVCGLYRFLRAIGSDEIRERSLQ